MLGNPYEYLETAREIDDVGLMLETYVDRIPFGLDDAWATHVAGSPAGRAAVLRRPGEARARGRPRRRRWWSPCLAATTAAAVLVTLRALGAEQVARRAAPFLVLTPAAVFMAVSADALFAAVAAWGLACLALGATARGRTPLLAWSVLAGLLLGGCVMLSYGLPLLGLLALAVLWSARSWRPLPVAAAAALAVVLVFAAVGFAWWEAYPGAASTATGTAWPATGRSRTGCGATSRRC